MLAKSVSVGIALVVMGAASLASAQVRSVAVAELSGRNSGAARRVIEEGLTEEGYTVVDAGADATIEGRAVARGARWRVDLTVRGADGQELGRVRMRVAGARGVRRLVSRLDAILEAASPATATAASEPGPTPTGDDRGTTPEPAGGATTDVPDAPARRVDPRDEDDAPPTDDFPIHALVQVGAGIRSRAIELLSPGGVDAAYRAEPYFEITARAEARFFDIAFVRAAFGSSAGLSSEREDPSLPPVDTLFVWLRADLGASYVIDRTVELGAAFGVSWDRYELAFNELVPTAEYLALRPALVTAFHLVPDRLLVLDAEIGLRFPLGVGELESVYGVDHDAFGVDGLMRLHGVIDPGFAWAVEAGFRHYWLDFAQTSATVSGSDAGWHLTGYVGWRF